MLFALLIKKISLHKIIAFFEILDLRESTKATISFTYSVKNILQKSLDLNLFKILKVSNESN